MPVQPVLIERDDDVRIEPTDCRVNVGLEVSGVNPRQHAVLVVEQHEIGYAEHARRLPQFLRSRFAESRPLTMFAMRQAE